MVVIGSGGREHALTWKIAQSDLVDRVTCYPGNPGTAQEPKTENVTLDSKDQSSLITSITDLRPDLVVVGPEQPLVEGLSDRLREEGLDVLGPVAGAARLEGSKAFAKALMAKADVPTARYFYVTDLDEAIGRIDEFPSPPVVKADGLAAGKGVTVADTHEEARETVRRFMADRLFGDAGASIVLEERLEGIEASYIVVTDGTTVVPLTSSQDHKRLLDDDKGPNTGGMGAFSPTPHLTEALESEVLSTIIEPVLTAIKAEGLDYRGFLYAGLMLTADGPRVLEFNVRAGDPETQAVLFGLNDDLVPVLKDAAAGVLSAGQALRFTAAATIVMAADGYPTNPKKGMEIHGLELVAGDAKVFHAGTRSDQGRILTAGGRVLAVTARGDDLPRALKTGYAAVEKIHFDGAHFRRDIGRSVL